MTELTPPSPDTLTVVVGPTASGKTDLAIRLATEWGGEIVNADSVQIYRHFDIGTGKPSKVQLRAAPHHLLDITEPNAPMDAATWATLAARTITEIRARGAHPILCGGTFLWVRALLYGLAPAPPGSPELRTRHQAFVEANGREALHAELAKVDPISANKLAPADFVRVSRALEVHQLSGKPMSAWQAEHGFRSVRYQARLIGALRSREELDLRIAERVRAMLDAGWAAEVRSLQNRGFADTRAMGAVGYRQIVEAQDAHIEPSNEALFDPIYRATRRYARRQRTWLRDEPVQWVAPV